MAALFFDNQIYFALINGLPDTFTTKVILSFVTVFALILVFKRRRKHHHDHHQNSQILLKEYDRCAFPNCIRCKRRSEIMTRARTLFRQNVNGVKLLTLDEHEEMSCQLQEYNTNKKRDRSISKGAVQDPEIFYLPHIGTQTFWNVSECLNTNILTENVFQGIKSEYESVKIHISKTNGSSEVNRGSWKVNNTPNGKWCFFHLIDQGCVTKNAPRCPKTMNFLFSVRGFMNNTVFGNAGFSVIYPGTHITEHFGPTNIRLRCHLGLQISEDCYLTVGNDQCTWNDRECLIFDDSFLHSATNYGKKERVILLFDIWHPDIPYSKRLLLQDIFSAVPLDG
ncbi:aspartate beta-hydroxylase domain-containing protein 2 [Patella vulgata]|uniref:aspartate beta-hydroxylase domain-containing protein 2 n=1 Tax=Patella vulgata TaxID=6465 RepID=UPI00217FAF6A|nr:aspartate beta-hydroxylase domain-containing protein 2 [Patella vulgata]